MEDLTGRQFGPYKIVAPLGEGGMAAVYKAYHASMERYVAIKILPSHFAEDHQFVARFELEVKTMAQLQHPHILPVFDHGQVDGYAYIVMPLIQCGTLANLLKGKPLPLFLIRQVVSQVGDALNYAHTHGLIHRDVKPSNILIDEGGNCLLTDFGLARMVETSLNLTTTGAIMGTPAYMSPEQGSSLSIDVRSDIYSLGVILYEMATGRVPYKAETPVAVIIKHIQDPLPPARVLNPALPEAVQLVILKALSKKPEDRYQTAGEMVAALQSACSNPPASFSKKGVRTLERTIVSAPVAGLPRRATRVWVSALVGAAALFVAGVLLAVFGINANTVKQVMLTAVPSVISDRISAIFHRPPHSDANGSAVSLRTAPTADNLSSTTPKQMPDADKGRGEDSQVSAPAAEELSSAKSIQMSDQASLPPLIDATGVAGVQDNQLSAGASELKQGRYLVIDLSGGTNARRVPMTYLAEVPKGGWTDEYKTTKLVMRRIEPGTFVMGSPEDELGRRDDESRHQVSLTKTFYIGVFELTRGQMARINGLVHNPHFIIRESDEVRPVECGCYDNIRGSFDGAKWPDSDGVDADSIMGKLRTLTGLAFDLPTEAQWEYACRAGTTTALNSGKNLTSIENCSRLVEVARYKANSSDDGGNGDTAAYAAKVGSYMPNAWGLYDMHGNVGEFCLDWYGSYGGTESDPKGCGFSSLRVCRGGSCSARAFICRSAFRMSLNPHRTYKNLGVRLVLPFDDQ